MPLEPVVMWRVTWQENGHPHTHDHPTEAAARAHETRLRHRSPSVTAYTYPIRVWPTEEESA